MSSCPTADHMRWVSESRWAVLNAIETAKLMVRLEEAK